MGVHEAGQGDVPRCLDLDVGRALDGPPDLLDGPVPDQNVPPDQLSFGVLGHDVGIPDQREHLDRTFMRHAIN